jgi:hypothetical protein
MGFLATTTGVSWLLAAAVLGYLSLIVLLVCVGIFSSLPHRRRTSERMLRLLWIGKRQGPTKSDD